MKREYLLALLLILSFHIIISQEPISVFLFHGQGSDSRIFDSLKVPKGYRLVHVKYFSPPKNCSMQDYAKQLSKGIDTTSKFILVGMSLGGMICCELHDLLKPVKTIIISSAKCREELPFRYRFQKIIPLYAIFPPKVIKWGAKILQPVVEPDRNKFKSTFKNMLNEKDPLFLKRTIKMIVRWDKTFYSRQIRHIHGDNDHTIPVRNVRADVVVKNGSHMMTLTRYNEINNLISSQLIN